MVFVIGPAACSEHKIGRNSEKGVTKGYRERKVPARQCLLF